MKINFENLTDEQLDHIINILFIYKQANKDKDVYLNEKCIKEAIYFMNTFGKDMASQLGMD